LDIVNGLEVITGNQAIIEHGKASPADVSQTWGDNAKITALNCHPKVSILDGLQNTVNWYMENREALKDIDF
jgi:nucleoside-diphosphate-sugar epimerase